jgi:Spy/CpxP family protein refolding chaperone
MEEFMKKYVMMMFSVLMGVLLVLPITIQAEEAKEPPVMKPAVGAPIMRGPGGPMGPHDWLSSLNLDEEVLQKMKEMKLKHKEKMLELKNQIEKKELEMEKVLMEKKLDLNKLLAVHDEISALRQKI